MTYLKAYFQEGVKLWKKCRTRKIRHRKFRNWIPSFKWSVTSRWLPRHQLLLTFY